MNRLLLGLDFETSGLDPKVDRVVEVGLVHWCVEKRMPVRLAGFLVKPDIEIAAEKWAEIEPITEITKDDVESFGRPSEEALAIVTTWAKLAVQSGGALCAFNGTDFDKLFLEEWQRRFGGFVQTWGWIDTRLDVPEPLTGSLLCIAAKQGFLNPFPHRAVTDVLTMLRVLDSYDIEKVIERSKIPNVTVQALVSFDDKDKAKKRGYYWKPETKEWLKRMKECDVEKENAEADFRLAVMR
ncbi:MAG: 3'-5' exonuclease [Mycobacteriales bacterium]